VVGACTLDRYGTEDLPGGGATYGALALAGLGARVTLVTAAGQDFPGQTAFSGLEARIAPAAHTARFLNRYDGRGRRSQHLMAAPARLAPEAWPGLPPAELLFLAPVFQELDPRVWCARVPGRLTGLALQGLVRDAVGEGTGRRVVPRRYEPGEDELRGVNAVFLSEEDLDGQGDLLERLRPRVPLVALTRGSRGASLLSEGGQVDVGVYPTREVDPTGAGDVFAAAFLLALAAGQEPAGAGRLAAAAASVVVEARGPLALARVGEAWARRAGVVQKP
jgi:hypothetical protein